MNGTRMLRGLRQLAWLEIKIFVREPMGVIGTVVMPVVMVAVLGRLFAGRLPRTVTGPARAVTVDLPIMASLLIALSTVLSLVTIIAIYREGGVLKRLRATPLRPHTILGAHVIVKLLMLAVTVVATLLLGARYSLVGPDVPLVSFGLGLLFTTLCILSIGFVIASVVPTARFAQPVGGLILYPMLGLSGMFTPVDSLPPALQMVARVTPLTYAVSLLRGLWHGAGWLAHAGDVAALALVCGVCLALSARIFRWE